MRVSSPVSKQIVGHVTKKMFISFVDGVGSSRVSKCWVSHMELRHIRSLMHVLVPYITVLFIRIQADTLINFLCILLVTRINTFCWIVINNRIGSLGPDCDKQLQLSMW
jgi:hypothetical protein